MSGVYGLRVYNANREVSFDLTDRLTIVIFEKRIEGKDIPDESVPPTETFYSFDGIRPDWSKTVMTAAGFELYHGAPVKPNWTDPGYAWMPYVGGYYSGVYYWMFERNVNMPSVRFDINNGVHGFYVKEPINVETGMRRSGRMSGIWVRLVTYK